MNREKLENDLEQLKTEIKNIDGIDSSTAGRLEQIVEDLRVAAGVNPGEGNQPAAGTDDIRSSIENFEIEHPAVTRVLGRITNLLSDMGI